MTPFVEMHELLSGNINMLFGSLKEQYLSTEVISVINTIFNKPIDENKNFNLLKNERIENIPLVLDKKTEIKNEFERRPNIFVRLQKVLDYESVLEM